MKCILKAKKWYHNTDRLKKFYSIFLFNYIYSRIPASNQSFKHKEALVDYSRRQFLKRLMVFLAIEKARSQGTLVACSTK